MIHLCWNSSAIELSTANCSFVSGVSHRYSNLCTILRIVCNALHRKGSSCDAMAGRDKNIDMLLRPTNLHVPFLTVCSTGVANLEIIDLYLE